jgi:peptide chain release factor 2
MSAMDYELLENLKGLLEQLRELKAALNVEAKLEDIRELEGKMSKPGFWESGGQDDVIRKLKAIKNTVGPIIETEKTLEDAVVLAELALSEEDQATYEEAQAEYRKLRRALARVETATLLTGKHDGRNCFVYVHAGAGGIDSCDWAEMLMRMYMRYCENKGYESEIVDSLHQEEAGIKNATLHVKGENAYGYLKGETGVHRLVRVSPFDANRRRHTSFAAVEVLPEFDEQAEVEIDDKDLRIETFRSSGPGGQHVNVTDSAVRITHLPTGLVVQSQSQRSQFANRREAMSVLRSRIYRLEEAKRQEEIARLYGEKGEIAWGNQIRSYVLQPYQLVKDHRTDEETSNVQSVLDGDIDDFIEALLRLKAGRKK